ncbi:MAG: AAA family ATPase [Paludibacteraceae bacterium]|nr:AAA family ATPase [Paludibacteraceae bacterium]
MKSIIKNLEIIISKLDEVINNNVKDLREYKNYLWENQSELDRAEKSAVRHNVTQAVLSSEAIVERKKRIRKMIEIPYFGRIDFQEDKQKNALPIYIGIHSYYDTEKNENVIHDWRAPISTMFYDYETGKAQYESPLGIIKGIITLKRQYRIRRSVMEFMLESSVNIQDDILQKELSSTSDERMKNIVATIQREQNLIIRNEEAKTLIIQGVAGSGKTSIALHRVAYILYRFKGEITSKDILIISPNKVFADYISNVLPELGEETIEECGFEELMSKQLQDKYKFQTFFEQVTEVIEKHDEAFIERIRFKSSVEFIDKMDKFFLYVENNCFQATDIKIGRIPVPKEYIEERFKAYHRIPMRSRFEPIAKDIIRELQITAPNLELTTTDKNNIKAEIKKMFSGNNDLSLYQSFYEWLGKPELFKRGKNRQLEYADVAPLLYLKLKMEGLKEKNPIKHLLVDEMQDYTPIQYKVLSLLFPCNKTILGDALQSVNPYSSTNYMDIQRVLAGAEVMKLCKSYRSSYEITNFAQKISKSPDLIAIERHGAEPEVLTFNTADKELEYLHQYVSNALKGTGSIGIICKTEKEAIKLHSILSERTDQVCLLSSESAAFSNGIIVTTAHTAKGLEFDEVIVPFVTDKEYNNEMDRSLLYIACTRAMHRLTLTATKVVSPIIK